MSFIEDPLLADCPRTRWPIVQCLQGTPVAADAALAAHAVRGRYPVWTCVRRWPEAAGR